MASATYTDYNTSPKCVVIRFTGWPNEPVEGVDAQYTTLVSQVLRLMNIDRHAVTSGANARPRCSIAWVPSEGAVEFTFYFKRKGWAAQSLKRVDLLRAYSNCTITLTEPKA